MEVSLTKLLFDSLMWLDKRSSWVLFTVRFHFHTNHIIPETLSIFTCQSPAVKDNLYYVKKWSSEYSFWSAMKWFNNNVSLYFLNDFKTLMHYRGLPQWHNEMGQFRLQPAVWGSPYVQSSMTVLSPFLFIFLFLSKCWVIFLKRGMSLSISHIQLVINFHRVKTRYFLELNLLLHFDHESCQKIHYIALLTIRY